MNSMKVDCGVLPESISNKELNVVSYLGVELRAWKCTVGKNSDSGTVSDRVNEGMCYLDKELNRASVG
jgi:hypothetical protein